MSSPSVGFPQPSANNSLTTKPPSVADETAPSSTPTSEADVMVSHSGLTPVTFKLEARPALTPSSSKDVITPPCPSVEAAFAFGNFTPSGHTRGRCADQRSSPSLPPTPSICALDVTPERRGHVRSAPELTPNFTHELHGWTLREK